MTNSMKNEATTGRCLCGDIRFEYRCTPIETVHCHCETCRRHSSSPFTTFIVIDKGTFRYTHASTGRLSIVAGGRTHALQPVGGTDRL